MSTNYALTKDQIVKNIASIKGRSNTLQEDIHKTAMAAMLHAFNHNNDFSLCSNLYNALPSGVRKNALATWFQTFAPMVLRNVSINATQGGRAKKVKLFKLDKSANAQAYEFDKAAETPFYDLTKESEPTVMTTESLLKALENLAKKADKQVNEGMVHGAEADSIKGITERILGIVPTKAAKAA